MSPLDDDLPLEPSPLRMPPDDEKKPIWPWVAGFVIVALAVAGFFYWRRAPEPAPKQAVEAKAPAAPVAVKRGLGPAVEPIDLPALDLTDPIVQQLVRRLSQHPAILAWLATPGLIRNIAVCIENVADGKSPAQHLVSLKPVGPFRAMGEGPRTIDPRSFIRYDNLAFAVSALDMNGVARLYSQLKPRLDEAYQQLGHAAGDIDTGTETALVHLLETPDAPANAAVVQSVLSYHY